MSRTMRWTTLVVLGLVLAGCGTMGKRGPEEAPPVEERGAEAAVPPAQEGAAGAAPGAEASGVAGEGALAMDPLKDPASPLAQRTVYFDFDSSVVKPEFQEMLKAHAAYLVDHPDRRLILEGHTDERGTREYNLGLGERRAQAVKRALVLLGAPAERIETVSYGEERPAAEGHDESAWRLNRRVELVYPEG